MLTIFFAGFTGLTDQKILSYLTSTGLFTNASALYLCQSMEQCIVYFSSSPNLSVEELHSILAQSRSNNIRQGVTGVMLYVRGSIIQVLEGDPKTVEQLYQRIQQDPRHNQVNTVLNRPIAHRTFEKWSMGFETITTQQLEEIKALVDLDDPQGRGSQADEPILLRTLKVFYDSNRYN